MRFHYERENVGVIFISVKVGKAQKSVTPVWKSAFF